MNKTTEALKLALEYCDDNMSAEAANVLRMALADHIANTDKMVGCDYCDNPLFAGTKCNNCGRVTLAEPVKQEPVAVISESAIGLVKLHSNGACLPFGTPLYAAPVQPVKQEPVSIPDHITCPFCESNHVPYWLHDLKF